ncbi:MAG: MoaD/ThiS family protein [Acidimicrobiales bacterium]
MRLPTILGDHAGGARTLELEGGTIGDVLRALDDRFPAVGRRVLDEQGRIRRHVHVYVGDERVRSLTEATPSGTEVTIMAAISGGMGLAAAPPQAGRSAVTTQTAAPRPT